MSDLNLLLFGCGVTTIAVAAAYVFIRESFTAQAQQSELALRTGKEVRGELPDVA